jgi:hypothetical protein
MKQKFVALFMIAMMALTVCGAVVVTTQKAAANNSVGPVPIVVQYQPGAKYTYTPQQFNLHQTWSMFTSGTKQSGATTGGALYTSISTRTGQAGDSGAQAGTYWQLTLPSVTTFDDIKDQPCKVTMKVNYHIRATGSKAKAGALAQANYIQIPAKGDYVYGNDPVHWKSAIETFIFEYNVGDVFAPSDSAIYGQAAAISISDSFGVGQASSAVVCSSIVLEFPAS